MQSYKDNAEIVLALDIGGTSIKSALFQNGKMQRLPQVPTNSDGTADEIKNALMTAIAQGGKFDFVVAALPGPFDFSEGRFLMKHKFASVYGKTFEELTGRCGRFVHDANAFLLGELHFGAAKGRRRVGGITLGTGLGAAFAVDGKLLKDAEGSPAENVSLWNRPYRDGIAEDYVSTRRLVRDYPAPNVRSIAEAANAGNAEARQVFLNYGSDLFALLRFWQPLTPDAIVLGGQIAQSLALFGEPPNDLPPILSAQLGADAALYGAYAECIASFKH